MDATEIKHFVEAALLAAGRPMNVAQIQGLFDGRSAPEKSEIREAVARLNEEYEDRGIVIAEVASGFRVQVRQNMADRLHKLWEGRAPRYSRALFETLALIAYRQPITRGEIEDIRGVSVSPNITRTLMERDWVRVVGHRDVPGRPEMFGTTKAFLDYFGLRKLEDLPPLADLADWESVNVQLDLTEVADDAGTEGGTGKDLPVLYPEAGSSAVEPEPGSEPADSAVQDEDVAVPDDAAADRKPSDETSDKSTDKSTDNSIDDSLEELVVKEWPDPLGLDETQDAVDVDGDEERDPDASASGG